MTDVDAEKTEAECEDAREAADMGEKPDLGHKADALIEALDGTDSGSDTRAGSLRGGSASGSDDDPDSLEINEALAEEGRASAGKRGRAENDD
ncbi:MAG: ribonuclease [Caulobacterales bacterium RIFCSPHIGHO2_01_FULL_67_30]|nr:MAG: ribonuclease [Caulobacterales bacterium RIFCSPHIGHO2_01_FULL_67_30]